MSLAALSLSLQKVFLLQKATSARFTAATVDRAKKNKNGTAAQGKPKA
jgi:hypothetical protein